MTPTAGYPGASSGYRSSTTDEVPTFSTDDAKRHEALLGQASASNQAETGVIGFPSRSEPVDCSKIDPAIRSLTQMRVDIVSNRRDASTTNALLPRLGPAYDSSPVSGRSAGLVGAGKPSPVPAVNGVIPVRSLPIVYSQTIRPSEKASGSLGSQRLVSICECVLRSPSAQYLVRQAKGGARLW